MTEKNDVIEKFLGDLDCKAGTGNGIGYGTIERLRRFAIKEGYIQDKNQPARI